MGYSELNLSVTKFHTSLRNFALRKGTNMAARIWNLNLDINIFPKTVSVPTDKSLRISYSFHCT